MTSQASPETTQQPEPEYLTRARHGDREAFADLYNEYQENVFRYLMKRVGNRDLAEDLTQETFVRALRQIAAFAWRGQSALAWLVTIARNLVIDHFRSHKTKREWTTGEIFALDTLTPSTEDLVVRATWASDLVDKAMAPLPAAQKTVIELRFLAELSVPETAAAMDTTAAAVRARTHKAMRNMRSRLGVAA